MRPVPMAGVQSCTSAKVRGCFGGTRSTCGSGREVSEVRSKVIPSGLLTLSMKSSWPNSASVSGRGFCAIACGDGSSARMRRICATLPINSMSSRSAIWLARVWYR